MSACVATPSCKGRTFCARRQRRARRARQRGFNLLEMLIVLSIMALLMTLVGPRLIAQLDRSKSTAASVQIRSLISSLKTMHIDLGRYPTTEEGLVLLVSAPADTNGGAWFGPYIEGSSLPKDPWGRDYIYQPPASSGAEPSVGSLGADGKIGGEGAARDIFSSGPPAEETTR